MKSRYLKYSCLVLVARSVRHLHELVWLVGSVITRHAAEPSQGDAMCSVAGQALVRLSRGMVLEDPRAIFQGRPEFHCFPRNSCSGSKHVQGTLVVCLVGMAQTPPCGFFTHPKCLYTQSPHPFFAHIFSGQARHDL